MIEFNFTVASKDKSGGKVLISRNDGTPDPGDAIVVIEGGSSSAVVSIHELALAMRAADELVQDVRDTRTRNVGGYQGQNYRPNYRRDNWNKGGQQQGDRDDRDTRDDRGGRGRDRY